MKIGQLVAVNFLDHAVHTGPEDAGPIEIVAYGRILSLEKSGDSCRDHMVLGAWLTVDPSYNASSELYTILLSAIIKVKRLR